MQLIHFGLLLTGFKYFKVNPYTPKILLFFFFGWVSKLEYLCLKQVLKYRNNWYGGMYCFIIGFASESL